MTDTRVLSNQRVTVWAGPDNAIEDYTAPKLAEIQTLLNVSEAVNWDSFDFNLQASDSQDDRTLTDGAGAKSRSFSQFGGKIEFVWPKPTDTGSIYRQAYNLFKTQRQKLAIVIRTVKLNSFGIAVGDRVNAYRVMSDATALIRGKASYAYTIDYTPQDDLGVNAIVPAAIPNPVTLLPAGPINVTIGTPVFLKAEYEGNNVTVGAVYESSNDAALEVTKHGILIGHAVGSYTLTPSFPGSAAGTPVTVNVTA